MNESFEPSDAPRLPAWRRVVVKVGSNLIAPEGRRISTRHLLPIARFVAECADVGREVVVVSSGAVAAGRAELGATVGAGAWLGVRQALAAIGQPRMFDTWARLIDRPCAQVLLSRDDLQNRRRFVNAKNTLRALLELRAVPIVNENDSVAVDELRVGDNDNLAAHVAVLVEADLLVILSDVAGVFESDPRTNPAARMLRRIERIDEATLALAGGAGSAVGTGGMRTKLEAARKAAASGIPTVIASGRDGDALGAVARGEVPGTLIERAATRLNAKSHWLKHALVPAGRVFVDDGASAALLARGASLLPAGVVDVEGEFRAGDLVEVVRRGADGERAIARGLAQYDAGELRRIRGRPSSAIAETLGYPGAETAIHRDDLVLL
jgi:glutamate 5-kinase